MVEPNANGWGEWGKHVLKELERLNECYERLHTDVAGIKTDIATLKVKSGMWGAIAGMVPAAIYIIYSLLK